MILNYSMLVNGQSKWSVLELSPLDSAPNNGKLKGGGELVDCQSFDSIGDLTIGILVK